MKHTKLLITIVTFAFLSTVANFHVHAKDFNYSPVSELPQEEDTGDYIKLLTDGTAYKVKQDDTLWSIADEKYGDGSLYKDILEMNRETLKNPNIILPGETIMLPEYLYIPRSNTPAMEQEGAFRIEDAAIECYNSPLEADIPMLYVRNSISIFSGVADNRMGLNALTESWEDFVAEVERSSEEICGGRVTDLTFEQYRIEDGCDLCGYTFTLVMPDKVREVAVFYRLGEQNMAEIIGSREKKKNAALVDAVRYVAASFEDLGGEINAESGIVEENVGAGDWNYPNLHNLFRATMDNYGLRVIDEEETTGENRELTWEEPLFENVVRNALVEIWMMDDEEKAEFMARPVTESDMAIVGSLSCGMYYRVATNKTKVQLRMGGYSEEIFLDKGQDFSLADIANFTSLERLSLDGMQDYSFLSGIPHLKSLTIDCGRPTQNVDFLAQCTELESLNLHGDGFGMLTDLTVLANCKELRRLYLQTPRVTDFSFLKECPQIDVMKLTGERSDGQLSKVPDLELLPNAREIEFYGREVR
ncbi:MAG: LysM peptidoglycan-binding domain-containing protein [Lachnospiraceae bacterium]|nr:LysM peptidoglycan-binding domain-containing protein [Lachnospiraceae bacterium]